MCDEKRKRSPNWLSSEKRLLVDLVKEHLRVIENKKTDGVSMKAKLTEWQIISEEYNSQTTHCHRRAENLKNQWENMKKAAKREALHARMRIQTGGGPPDPKDVYTKILSLINNPYDNDSEAPVKADSATTELNKRPMEVKIEMDDPEAVIEVKVSSVDKNVDMMACETQEFVDKESIPAQLKTGISRKRPLYTPAKSSTVLLHKKRIEAINLQKALAIEEAERKKALKLLDIEIKREIIKQEKLKTKILLLELRKKRKEFQESLE